MDQRKHLASGEMPAEPALSEAQNPPGAPAGDVDQASSASQEPAVAFGFDWALLPQGWARDVVFTVSEAGHIVRVATDVGSAQRENSEGRQDVVWTNGSVLPGMANVHSHAHQRLMAGLAERSGPGSDSFWTWREVMYSFVGQIGPEQLEAAAAMAYVEMLEAGFTAVGEFQYLHNQPDGSFYDQRAELSLRCLAAARETGIAITLLPVLYCRGGFDGRALAGGQQRFATDVDGLLEMVATLRAAADGVQAESRVQAGSRVQAESTVRVGIAPHSLRAVGEEELLAAVRGVRGMDPEAPIHLHIAEQTAEVDDCLEACGQRPVEHLLEQMAAAGLGVDAAWCLIHATHLSIAECHALAASQAVVGLCPTTEANLGDGVFSAREYLGGGDDVAKGVRGRIAIGTDSQVRISVIEDLRQLETTQRLRHHERNVLAAGPATSTGRTLYGACAEGGAQALAQPMGTLAVGRRADFVVLDGNHARLMERSEDALLDSWIFAGDSRCVAQVYLGGKLVVEGGCHKDRAAVTARFRLAMQGLKL